MLRRLPLRSLMYGWPVSMSTEGTCEVVCVRGDPPSVVGLGVSLVDGMEALWVAPSEVLGGKYGLEAPWVAPSEVLGGLWCDAAWLAAQLHVCALWVG